MTAVVFVIGYKSFSPKISPLGCSLRKVNRALLADDLLTNGLYNYFYYGTYSQFSI